MRFVLCIELGNDAMQCPDDVLRAIRKCRAFAAGDNRRAFDVGEGGKLFDDNGNCVGAWHTENE